ncbi:MAG: tetratricopeptide repeat protein [Terracidiphilus sp.]
MRVWATGGLACVLAGAALQSGAQAPDAANPETLKQADTAFREGVAARQSGDLAQAQEKFALVVKLEPQIAEAHEALGAVLLELNKPTEAIAELEAASGLKPGEAGNEANLAMAYAASGDAAKAISHFEAALHPVDGSAPAQMDASFYDAYGHALAAAGRPGDAIAQFEAEEGLAGEHAEIEDAIGSLYAQEKQWDEARKRFEHAIQLNGSLTSARIHLGVLQRERGDITESLTTLEAAAKADPPDARGVFEYGRTLAAAGRDDEAAGEFATALKANPQLTGAQLELAMALQRLGRQEEAIPWFEQVVAREPENEIALTNLGLALTLTGKAKDGLAILQRAQVMDAQNPVVYKDIGVAHVQLSAFDEAIADFKKALTLDPNDPQLHYDLGLAYKFKDRYDEAIRELSRAGEMDPTLQDPPYTLGILLMQIGKLDDAVVQLQKATVLRPENGDAWAILGSTLKQDARLPEAADALRKAIPLLPGQPGPRVTLAGVLAEEAGNLATEADNAESAGDSSKAADLRKQMTALRTEAAALRTEAAALARSAVSRQQANFAMNAGNQLLLRGQIADAIARYQESISSDPTFAEPHAQLAIAYERQGRSEDAKSERQKAAELGRNQGTGARE